MIEIASLAQTVHCTYYYNVKEGLTVECHVRKTVAEFRQMELDRRIEVVVVVGRRDQSLTTR